MPQPLTRERGSATVEIVCDFDGTVARPDTIDQILEALADPAWRSIEERWERGEIDSRECMARQIPLIRGGWRAIARFLDERVSLDPSFAPFAAWCAARDLSLRIGSEGIEQVIRHLLGRDRVAVHAIWASRLRVARDGALALDFSHASGRTHCGAALCKCELFPRSPGRSIRLLVGDGRSDFCAAEHADVVFARAALLEHCRTKGIRAIAFESFETVRAFVERHVSLPVSTVEEPAARLAASR